MKTTNIVLTLLIPAMLFSGQARCENVPARDENSANSSYSLVKDVSGIRIYMRWIPVGEAYSAKEVKAEFIAGGTVHDALKVLRDDRSIAQWMNGTKEYYRVRTIDNTHWYSYIQFATPWPLNNRDIIIKYEVTEELQDGKIVIRMTGDPYVIQVFDGVKRILHMVGSWTVTDLGNNTVKVEYVMFSNQKPEFPRWITDPIIQKSLVKTMTAFQDIMKKQR